MTDIQDIVAIVVMVPLALFMIFTSVLLVHYTFFVQTTHDYCEDKGFDYSTYNSDDHLKVEGGYIRCCKEKADSNHEIIESCKIIKDGRDLPWYME
jgi:hypothetical protein